jgi:hypothetical protein
MRLRARLTNLTIVSHRLGFKRVTIVVRLFVWFSHHNESCSVSWAIRTVGKRAEVRKKEKRKQKKKVLEELKKSKSAFSGCSLCVHPLT